VVGRGELVGVVGVVGAGKSSLLSALLGEMAALGGPVRLAAAGGRKARVSTTTKLFHIGCEINFEND
jgi:ABC-type hemin transport system ATPase subunit